MIYKGTDTVLKYSAKATASPWIAIARSSVQHRRIGVASLSFFGQVRARFACSQINFFCYYNYSCNYQPMQFLYMFCGVLPSSLLKLLQ